LHSILWTTEPTEESDEADVSQESFDDYKIEIVPSNQKKAVKKSSTVCVHVPKDIFSTVVSHDGGPKNGSEYFGVGDFLFVLITKKYLSIILKSDLQNLL